MIKLGYEISSGKEVSISPSHMIVTGVSQLAGKTTALESLIKRSGKKAIVFRTKIGEKSFLDGNIIKPYYKDKADWRYIESLIEATMQQKLRSFDRSKIIQLSKTSGANTLIAFKKKVDERLLTKKLNSFENDILTNIQAYLEIVLPKLQSIQFADSLALVEGLNIMDLERFSRDSEVQSLVIRSTVEEVLYNHKDVIIVIPEAWRFLPQSRGNPCKQIVEEFIRQGATNRNYIWIDSQDMTGVDKTPLKQITEWILGYQSEKNEVKHTLDQLPLPKSLKPKDEDIMSLGTGMFYYATRESTKKVYAQPFWLDDERAKQIALGNLSIKDIDKPKPILLENINVESESMVSSDSTSETISRVEFNKILNDEMKNITREWNDKFTSFTYKIELMNKEKHSGKMQELDRESLINEILAKIPEIRGQSVVYTVSPIEKIKKDFLEVAKNKIMDDINGLNEKAKQMMKYIESRGVGVAVNEICIKCFLMKSGDGGYAKQVNEYGRELIEKQLANKHTNGKFQPLLKERIKDLTGIHGATEQDIQQVYDHIIFEILGDKK